MFICRKLATKAKHFVLAWGRFRISVIRRRKINPTTTTFDDVRLASAKPSLEAWLLSSSFLVGFASDPLLGMPGRVRACKVLVR